jgi:anti-sigma factor RsiW
MNFEINETVLQKLADGELTHEERTQVLGHLDDDPSQWRVLALTFVELQIWNETIPAARPPVSRSETGALRNGRKFGFLSTPRKREAILTAARGKAMRVWSTVAIAVLLAFGFGYLVAHNQRPTIGPPTADSGTVASLANWR